MRVYLSKCHPKLRLYLSKYSLLVNRNEVVNYASFSCSSRGYSTEVTEKKEAAESLSQASTKLDRSPFGKNLFLGKFDTNVLAYPEVLDRDRLQTLDDMVNPLERFFEEKVDHRKIDSEAKIPDDVMQGLKDFGLFGQMISTDHGGLGLSNTEYARLGEIIALDGSIAVTLAAHQAIGLKGILIVGTEEQKQKYLPRLATGEWLAAFALTEPGSGSDAASVTSRAVQDEEGNWILNGSKIWISNGGWANLFTVFAKTNVINSRGEPEDKITAFIVERDFGGVTHGNPEDKLGIRGSNTTQVFFENTKIPAENVLGKVGGGFKVALNILNSGRFSMGSSGAGILKKMMGWVITHVNERQQFGKPLREFELVQQKLGKMAIQTYAMESMAYLTAGMLDTYAEPDCAMEAAMVKIFSSEAVWEGASECLQLLGGLGYIKDYPYERILRDSRIMLIFEGTNEILRVLVSLLGVQFAGNALKDMVVKLRNPLFHPSFIWSELWNRRRQIQDKPALTLRLYEYLHPSLTPYANELEYCVLRLQYATQIVLTRHGRNVVDKQFELARLADIAITIYGMTAVLSRSSRAYCIGLRHADQEIQMARTFCLEGAAKVRRLVSELQSGEETTDGLLKDIAKNMCDNGGFCASHPLTRNF